MFFQLPPTQRPRRAPGTLCSCRGPPPPLSPQHPRLAPSLQATLSEQRYAALPPQRIASSTSPTEHHHAAAEHHLLHITHSHHHCSLSPHPLSGVVILLTLEFPCEDRASHCREAELLLAVERFTFDVVDLDCLRNLSRQRFSE